MENLRQLITIKSQSIENTVNCQRSKEKLKMTYLTQRCKTKLWQTVNYSCRNKRKGTLPRKEQAQDNLKSF